MVEPELKKAYFAQAKLVARLDEELDQELERLLELTNALLKPERQQQEEDLQGADHPLWCHVKGSAALCLEGKTEGLKKARVRFEHGVKLCFLLKPKVKGRSEHVANKMALVKKLPIKYLRSVDPMEISSAFDRVRAKPNCRARGWLKLKNEVILALENHCNGDVLDPVSNGEKESVLKEGGASGMERSRVENEANIKQSNKRARLDENELENINSAAATAAAAGKRARPSDDEEDEYVEQEEEEEIEEEEIEEEEIEEEIEEMQVAEEAMGCYSKGCSEVIRLDVNQLSAGAVDGIGQICRATWGPAFPKDITVSFIPGSFDNVSVLQKIEAEVETGFQLGFFGRSVVMCKANGPLCWGKGGIKGSFSLGRGGVLACRPYVRLTKDGAMPADRVCTFPFEEMEKVLPKLTEVVLEQAQALGFTIPGAVVAEKRRRGKRAKSGSSGSKRKKTIVVGGEREQEGDGDESLAVEINFDGQSPHRDGTGTLEILVVVVNLDQIPVEETVFEIFEKGGPARVRGAKFELARVKAYRVTGDGVSDFEHCRRELKNPKAAGRYLFVVVRKVAAEFSPQLFQNWKFRPWAERVKILSVARNQGIMKQFGLETYSDVWGKVNSFQTETHSATKPAPLVLLEPDLIRLCNLRFQLPFCSDCCSPIPIGGSNVMQERQIGGPMLLPRGARIVGTKSRRALNFLFPGLNLDLVKVFSTHRSYLPPYTPFVAGLMLSQSNITYSRGDVQHARALSESPTLQNILIIPPDVHNVFVGEDVTYISTYADENYLPRTCPPFPVLLSGEETTGCDFTLFVGLGSILSFSPASVGSKEKVLLAVCAQK
jgi:hypothetical protein